MKTALELKCPRYEGEDLHAWWVRAWQEGHHNGLTGSKSVIGRMRRGKYVRIPSEWRGRTVNSNQIRKRPSKRRKRRELTRQELIAQEDMKMGIDSMEK